MEEPFESVYFNWLCAKVMVVENPTPSLTYWTLLQDLHNTEFVWLLSGDDNRAEDGVDLRREFLSELNLEADRNWLRLGCSVLEMLIAFSRKAEFNTGLYFRDWFWKLIENLDLVEFNDANYSDSGVVDDILNQFIWRTYDFNGNGGLFPLSSTENDQRKVEIWYQFYEYLVDQDLS